MFFLISYIAIYTYVELVIASLLYLQVQEGLLPCCSTPGAIIIYDLGATCCSQPNDDIENMSDLAEQHLSGLR